MKMGAYSSVVEQRSYKPSVDGPIPSTPTEKGFYKRA